MPSTGLNDKQYQEAIAKSKVTMLPGVNFMELAVELGFLKEKSPGRSLTLEMTVTEPGMYQGRKAEYYPGIAVESIKMTHELYMEITGKPMPTNKMGFKEWNPEDLAGRAAVAQFGRTTDKDGKDRPDQEVVAKVLKVVSKKASASVEGL